jgi:hypothetical protein
MGRYGVMDDGGQEQVVKGHRASAKCEPSKLRSHN